MGNWSMLEVIGSNKRWEKAILPGQPGPRMGAASTVWKDNGLIFGGANKDDQSNELFLFHAGLFLLLKRNKHLDQT